MPGLPSQGLLSNLFGGLAGTAPATYTPVSNVVYYTYGSNQTATAVWQQQNIYQFQQYLVAQQYMAQITGITSGAESEENRKKRIAASDRAEELLLTFLRDEHKKTYKSDGFFDVEVKGRIYRVHKGRSMNITLLDKKGVKVCRFCAHPSAFVPDADTMLAQYLMLTTDEKKFLAVANKHRLAA